MVRPMKSSTADRGITIIEILISLVIIGITIPQVYQKIADYMNEKAWQVTAIHAVAYNNAAKHYIADNSAALLSGSLPYKITPTTLIQKGYLKPGFSMSTYGQSYITGVVKNAKTSKLEAMTCSTGGVAIPDNGIRSVASLIQGLGGYIDNNKNAVGVFGGWTDNPSNYGLNCIPGHIVIALSSEVLGTDLEESDRLYRFAVNGRPDLNRMHTAIDMGGNNLNNAGTVNANNMTANNDIRSNDGWLITRNNKGWLNETHGGGFYMSDNDWIRSVNNKNIYTAGQLKGGSVRSDSDLSAGGVLKLDKTSYAGTWCPQNGAISHDASGGILSCQSGLWRNAGKASWRVGGTFTVWPGQTQTLGRFKLCINTYRIDGREMALTQLVPTDAPDADGNMNWQAYNGTQYPAYYMGIHCFI